MSARATAERHAPDPSIPWYRYRAAFRELRPLIEANHAIIQAIDTSPHVPIQLREAS